MIGESFIDGVFVPNVLIVFMLAFVASLLIRRVLRHFNAYRFIWHGGLFDIAVFFAIAWLISSATVGATAHGITH